MVSLEIKKAAIRKVLDSRGEPTVEVDVYTENGFGRAAAPSGASRGKHEVMPYPIEGIDYAIQNFKTKVLPKLISADASNQQEIDNLLVEIDGTENFSNIGGNIAMITSIAVAKAAADSLKIPLYRYLGGVPAFRLPYPIGNLLGGGKHAIGSTDIQEFLIIPLANTVQMGIFANAYAHKRVKEKLCKKNPNMPLGKGDECAWVAKIEDRKAFEIMADVCEEVSSEYNIECKLGADFAASTLYKDKKYCYKNKKLRREEQINYIEELVDEYNLYYIEDPLEDDDFEGYATLTKNLGDKCLIVGDDLFTTNVKRLERGISMNAANAILVKPNQIGTISGVLKAVRMAHENNYKTIVSHRSGETTDTTIAHLSVATASYGIKTGAVGGERIAKLNELIRIEDELKGA